MALAVQLKSASSGSWPWVLSSGVLTSLLGLYFMVNPDTGAKFFTIVIGLFAVLGGAVLIFGAFQIRKAKPDLLALLER